MVKTSLVYTGGPHLKPFLLNLVDLFKVKVTKVTWQIKLMSQVTGYTIHDLLPTSVHNL